VAAFTASDNESILASTSDGATAVVTGTGDATESIADVGEEITPDLYSFNIPDSSFALLAEKAEDDGSHRPVAADEIRFVDGAND
jgi:hypothetical protein